MKLIPIGIAVAAALSPCLAPAQDYRSYYTVLHPQAFTLDWRAFYEAGDSKTAKMRADYPHRLDVPFGSHPKQRLDIYLPKGRPEKAPVLVFLHGGGFAEGDRAHYGYLARAYAERGVITVVQSYRLTSEGFHYPEPLHDVQAAILWVHRNIAAYGGDPDNIVASGHSAGAILVAEAGVDRTWLTAAGVPKTSLRGIVAVSGRYTFPPTERAFAAYVPTDRDKEEASPIKHIIDPAARFIVAVGSTEKEYLDPSRAFHAALGVAPTHSQLIILEGQNHQDSVNAFGTPGSPLFDSTLALLKGEP